jgi:hypothetical protein
MEEVKTRRKIEVEEKQLLSHESSKLLIFWGTPSPYEVHLMVVQAKETDPFILRQPLAQDSKDTLRDHKILTLKIYRGVWPIKCRQGPKTNKSN